MLNVESAQNIRQVWQSGDRIDMIGKESSDLYFGVDGIDIAPSLFLVKP